MPEESFIPKPGKIKIGGLGRAAQKLQAAREKAEHGKNGSKPGISQSASSVKPKTLAGAKKTPFQRKAV